MYIKRKKLSERLDFPYYEVMGRLLWVDTPLQIQNIIQSTIGQQRVPINSIFEHILIDELTPDLVILSDLDHILCCYFLFANYGKKFIKTEFITSKPLKILFKKYLSEFKKHFLQLNPSNQQNQSSSESVSSQSQQTTPFSLIANQNLQDCPGLDESPNQAKIEQSNYLQDKDIEWLSEGKIAYFIQQLNSMNFYNRRKLATHVDVSFYPNGVSFGSFYVKLILGELKSAAIVPDLDFQTEKHVRILDSNRFDEFDLVFLHMPRTIPDLGVYSTSHFGASVFQDSPSYLRGKDMSDVRRSALEISAVNSGKIAPSENLLISLVQKLVKNIQSRSNSAVFYDDPRLPMDLIDLLALRKSQFTRIVAVSPTLSLLSLLVNSETEFLNDKFINRIFEKEPRHPVSFDALLVQKKLIVFSSVFELAQKLVSSSGLIRNKEPLIFLVENFHGLNSQMQRLFRIFEQEMINPHIMFENYRVQLQSVTLPKNLRHWRVESIYKSPKMQKASKDKQAVLHRLFQKKDERYLRDLFRLVNFARFLQIIDKNRKLGSGPTVVVDAHAEMLAVVHSFQSDALESFQKSRGRIDVGTSEPASFRFEQLFEGHSNSSKMLANVSKLNLVLLTLACSHVEEYEIGFLNVPPEYLAQSQKKFLNVKVVKNEVFMDANTKDSIEFVVEKEVSTLDIRDKVKVGIDRSKYFMKEESDEKLFFINKDTLEEISIWFRNDIEIECDTDYEFDFFSRFLFS